MTDHRHNFIHWTKQVLGLLGLTIPMHAALHLAIPQDSSITVAWTTTAGLVFALAMATCTVKLILSPAKRTIQVP